VPQARWESDIASQGISIETSGVMGCFSRCGLSLTRDLLLRTLLSNLGYTEACEQRLHRDVLF